MVIYISLFMDLKQKICLAIHTRIRYSSSIILLMYC